MLIAEENMTEEVRAQGVEMPPIETKQKLDYEAIVPIDQSQYEEEKVPLIKEEKKDQPARVLQAKTQPEVQNEEEGNDNMMKPQFESIL